MYIKDAIILSRTLGLCPRDETQRHDFDHKELKSYTSHFHREFKIKNWTRGGYKYAYLLSSPDRLIV